jgi:hypothetical protein
MTREAQRLQEARDRTAPWKRWGPYLAERQWGTVREDYSPHGPAWNSSHYDVGRWLQGDPTGPPSSPERMRGRNHEWRHLYNEDVISMPDKWEYPWYAAWDLAFHTIPLALIDPDFAKAQLVLFLREWYMHPTGRSRPTSGRSAA